MPRAMPGIGRLKSFIVILCGFSAIWFRNGVSGNRENYFRSKPIVDSIIALISEVCILFGSAKSREE
jgi:hypothetical protein